MPTAVKVQQGLLHPNEILEKLSRWVSTIEPHLKCPICGDVITDAHVNPECMHRYCSECINHSLQECDDECPTCRSCISTHHNLRRDEQFEEIKNAVFELMKIIRRGRISLQAMDQSQYEYTKMSKPFQQFKDDTHSLKMPKMEQQPEPLQHIITSSSTNKRKRTPSIKMERYKNDDQSSYSNTTTNYDGKNSTFAFSETTATKKRKRKPRAVPARPQRDISDDYVWLEQFDNMKEYMRTNGGSIDVPNKHPYTDLYKWYITNKSCFKQKSGRKQSLLKNQRKALLDEIGFFAKKKTTEEIKEEKWFKMYEELKKFHEINGSCDVPTKNSKLYGWTKAQTNFFKNDLSRAAAPKWQSRKKLLEEINLFAPKNHEQIRQERWLQYFEQLKVVSEKNNGCLTFSSFDEDNRPLYTWMNGQRFLLKNLDKVNSSPFLQQRRKMMEQIIEFT